MNPDRVSPGGILLPPSILPEESEARKGIPIYSGVMAYFPLALAEIAKLSWFGNNKHNPGEPLHWSRAKSDDHADCIGRHLLEHGEFDSHGNRHSAGLGWRALALLQVEMERAGGPKARGAR